MFDQAFYEKKGIEGEKPQGPEPAAANESSAGAGTGSTIDVETLIKLASSPELASILKMLAKNI